MQLHRLSLQTQRAALRLREEQDVLHQVAEAARFLVDDRERPVALFVRPDTTEQERFCEHPDLRKRGSQFVRDVGDEFGAESVQLLLAPELQQRCHDQSSREQEEAQDERKTGSGQSPDDKHVRGVGMEAQPYRQLSETWVKRVSSHRPTVSVRCHTLGEIQEHGVVGHMDSHGNHRIVGDPAGQRCGKQRRALQRRRKESSERVAVHFEAVANRPRSWLAPHDGVRKRPDAVSVFEQSQGGGRGRGRVVHRFDVCGEPLPQPLRW